ncbi:uncharacterized protein LOC111360412 [Spodoptera litura]|uniref:Uncharacterized protein LOC111360412 n=1 Tax=Spodoptera litura TaxID=69820 RepID=A0A9J7EPI5_SPOLT|nr:uncharacterized protein LOC111360412 [Spodoptera litura]XP_022832107.1 uncharacterized protein LOC111360412 [Spodoptera litura]
MPPLTLEGDTLGERRRHFNKLAADAVASKHYELTPLSDTDNDIDNLLKIEIACKTRNVDYVIEVMKSKDMLYVATAIKKSTWIITDPQYANIINPEYLHTQLKPCMTTKAFNKLMLHIRLNLKDESRVETFYEHAPLDTDIAYHWLQNCSMPFIENVITTQLLVPVWLFKRLCKKFSHFFAYYTRVPIQPHERRQLVLFMLKSHTDDVLNILEDTTVSSYMPELGKKRTEFLLKTCPRRIIDNIKLYNISLDTTVLIKHINKNEIRTFLHKHANELGYYRKVSKLKNFIRKMNEEERVQFIRKAFIERTDMIFKKDEMRCFDSVTHSYQWYEFFPFDIAFTKIKNLIRKQTSPSERCVILSVLVNSAKHNAEHIKTLVTYVFQKHINVPFKFKIKFINNLLSNVTTHEFDEATWNMLDQIFHSMDVYTETENDVQLCLESIIVRKVLNDEPVPEVIEQKCTFNSFKTVIKTLNEEQKHKLFTYVFNSLLGKVNNETCEKESGFEETVKTLQNMFILLKDWNKTLTDFPIVIEKIQELIKAKEENKWTTDMSCLYNVNKSWRKYMFKESLSLSLCEETCLNALKHKPQLLTRHDKKIHTLRTNDEVSLRRVLVKLRVYWPDSLARHWMEAYMHSLNEPTGQKSIIKGLFVLLTANQVVEISKKYVPNDFSIKWGDTDQFDIIIRKNIAKHLYMARPLVPLDTVLWYAKGDYLQYSVPSLNAMISNLDVVESEKYLPKLLNAPVSLQKFGLHLAFCKFKPNELKSILSNVWQSSNNSSIRGVIFEYTYNQMCTARDETMEKGLWQLLSMFIDSLSSEEGIGIHKKLSDVERVPIYIQGDYYMKSYEYLTSLPESADCKKYVNDLLSYAHLVMHLLNEDFVINKLLSPAISKFKSLHECQYLKSLACFILCGPDEENQVQRFRKIIPVIDDFFQNWDSIEDERERCQISFEQFLTNLVIHSMDYFEMKYLALPIPAKVFADILTKIENDLPVSENYVIFTSWKLVTTYITLLNELMCLETDCLFNDLKLFPSFGVAITRHLKEDCDEYGPIVHHRFAAAFEKTLAILRIHNDETKLEILRHMLNDDEFIPAYLVVSNIMPKDPHDETKHLQTEILQKLKINSSPVVQLHFNNDFWEYHVD